ncbi:hypothetical protein C8Q75DRAFT_806071 [Abortiporus biennis]|nr:hypothetical protein C8Q75DRAFT_806071 [Abortiporus biennis]
MAYHWEPETQYNIGDVVEYEGHRYKIVQPHRSQADWTPPVVPPLWARLPEEYHNGERHEHPEQQPQGGHDEKKSWDQQTEQQVAIDHEEQKKSWHDIGSERKNQLEVWLEVVSLLVLLLLEPKNEEEKNAQGWGLQSWLKDAKARTEDFYRNGPRGPTTWVLTHGRSIPPGALKAGEEYGDPLYVCRAYYEGSLTVGKASYRLKKGAVIGFAHKEIDFDTYEILLADPNAAGVRWVESYGRLNLSVLGARPVEGGHESDGTPLYIARARHSSFVTPGKCSERLSAAFIPYNGTERECTNYQVLCLKV